MRFASLRNFAPASVSDTTRVVRRKSLTPSSRSKPASPRVTAAGERPSFRAAAAKPPVSAMATKFAKASNRSIRLVCQTQGSIVTYDHSSGDGRASR